VTTFGAFGDSLTLGIGDPIPQDDKPFWMDVLGWQGWQGWRGWAALLAQTLPECELHNFARNGARVADVKDEQLAAARELHLDFASVIVGMNDMLRADFDIERIAASLVAVVGALHDSGARVMTARLPDPGRMLGLPEPWSGLLASRAKALNQVIDDVAERFGTLHLDLAGDSDDGAMIYDRRMWSVDRLHPNERGHRQVARRFHQLLTEAGAPVGPPPGAEPENKPPARLEQFAWLVKAGSPWVVKRSGDLWPDLIKLRYGMWLRGRPLRAAVIAELKKADPALRAVHGAAQGAADRPLALGRTWLGQRNQQIDHHAAGLSHAAREAYQGSVPAGILPRLMHRPRAPRPQGPASPGRARSARRPGSQATSSSNDRPWQQTQR
jgi:lysophospholipase L1-like esterase